MRSRDPADHIAVSVTRFSEEGGYQAALELVDRADRPPSSRGRAAQSRA